MSTPLQYPLINGVKHDFSSIELKLAGQIFVGFRAINYNRTRTRTMVMGNSPDPLAKTEGVNAYTADCEIYLAEWNLLQGILVQAAAAAGIPSGTSPGSGYGDVLFQIVVTYSSLGFDTITDILNGCSLDTLEASQAQGPDALVRKITLNPLKIYFGGQDDLGTALQAPSGGT